MNRGQTTPARNRLFRCQYCKKCFIGVESFANHKRENHGDDIKRKRQNENRKETVLETRIPGSDQELGTKVNTSELEIKDDKLQLPPALVSPGCALDSSLSDYSFNDTSGRISEEDCLVVSSTTERAGCTDSEGGECNSLLSVKAVAKSIDASSSYVDSSRAQVPSDDDEDDEVVVVEVQDRGNVYEALAEEEDDDDIQVIAIISREEKENTEASRKITEPLSLETANEIGTLLNENEPATVLNVVEDVTQPSTLSMVNHVFPVLDADITPSSLEDTPQQRNNHNSTDNDTGFQGNSGKSSVVGRVLPMCRLLEDEDDTRIQQPHCALPEILKNSFPETDSAPEFDVPGLSDLTVNRFSVPDTDIFKQILAKSPTSTELGELSGGTPRISSVYSVPVSDITTDFQLQSVQPSPVRISILPVEKSKFKYKCWSCNEAFSKRKERSLHAKRAHGFGVYFKCNMCSEMFAQERSLIRHRVTHFQYPCTMCDRKFDGKQDFDAHVKLHESKAKKKRKIPAHTMVAPNPEQIQAVPVPFQLLSETRGMQAISVQEADLYVQEAAVGGDGKYSCPFCLVKLSNKFTLRRHFRKHTGEKPYKCSYCKRRFADYSHQQRHERNVHLTGHQSTVHQSEVSDSPKATPDSPVNYEGFAIVEPTGIRMPPPSGSNSSSASVCSIPWNSAHHNQRKQDGTYQSCDSVLSGEDILLNEVAHLKRKPYKCKYCDKHFNGKDSRKQHENMHTGLRPYKCRICQKGFHNPYLRKSHEKSTHFFQHVAKTQISGNFKEVPLVGPPVVPGIVEVSEHHSEHEDEIILLEKRSPALATETTSSLSEAHCEIFSSHSPGHSLSSLVSNRIAQVTSPQTSVNNPLRHLIQTPGMPAGKAKLKSKFQKDKCKICSKTVRKGYLPVHMRTHNKNRGFKCHFCVKTFPNLSSLQNHAKKHIEENPNACEICGEKFDSAGTLSLHRQTHKLERRRNHECIICGKTFFTPAELKSHNSIHSRPFPCPECEKTFEMEIRLEDHIRVVHTKETPFQCSVCQRRFASQVTYLRHITRNTCKPKATPMDIVYDHNYPFPTTHQSLDQELDVTENQTESIPPTTDQENESEDEEYGEDYNESSFYFKCSICSSEFTDEGLASEHTKWHRDQFRKQNSQT